MKKIFTKLMLLAVAATALASCAIDDTNDVATLPGVEVSINATTAEVTKSHFGDFNATDNTYPTLWDGTEKWVVCLNDTKITAEDIEYSDDKTSAHASVTFNEPEAYNGTYTLFAVSPEERYVSVSMENDYIRYRIPASQTPGEASCDAAAQVLIAQSEPAETVSGFDVAFKHAVAYVKFSFSNVAEGGNVTGVSISSEDVALAGRCVYAPSTKTFSFKDEAVYEINLTTTSTTDLWFACAPAAVQGKELTFTINTDKGKLSRPVTMPGNFEVGSVKTFTVNMTGIEYPVVENVVEWHKVTSLDDITEGEYVIVHDEQTKGAMVLPNTVATSGGPTQTGLSTKATVGDGILTNVDDSVIWNFIGDNTAMKVQSYANSDNYLYVSGSGNGNIRVASAGSNTTWKFTESNGGFAMQDSEQSRFCGIYKDGTDWRSYTSATAGNYGTNSNGTKGAYLTLYKKFSTDPAIVASNIEVAAEGGNGEATYSVQNMADDVTASTTTEWISNVSASEGKINYTVAANYTGAVRSGEIVLNSDGAGVSKTITVSQAADVFEVSATEISLGADTDATATFTVTSTHAFTLTSPDYDKVLLSVESGKGEVEVTVTILVPNSSDGEVSRGDIVVTRTGDNATKNVAVKQKAASTGGGDEPAVAAWTLVTDASVLAVGDQIIIAAKDSDYALGADKGNNRNAATITKSGNTLVNPGSDVEIITLEAGTVANTFAFKVSEGYLYAASSGSNYLKTKTTLDDNGSWAITIETDGNATIKAQGTYTRNWLRKNSQSALFSCYGSGQNDVVIYRLSGGNGGGETPDTPATPVLSVDSTTLSFDAAAGSKTITCTIENEVSGQNVTATASEDWLSTSVSGKTVTVTATANTGAARNATVTIAYAGAESKTVTVSQAAGNTGGGDSAEPVTESLNIYGTTGVMNGSTSISWEGTNFTVTNEKGSSSTAIRTSDSDHYRIYQNSQLVLTAKNNKKFTKLVITVSESKYATPLVNTLDTGATASGTTVTWVGSASEINQKVTAQTRISKIVATLE